MKKILILLSLIFSIQLYAGVSDVKIFMMGDSWAKLMCLNYSIEEALERFSIEAEVSCFRSSIMGSKSEDWNQPEKQNLIRKAFAVMSNIEVVILSIGGNDYFKALQNNAKEQQPAMSGKIRGDIKKNIEFLQRLKPNLKIVISGYDYSNFSILAQDNFLTHHYISIYNQVGRPNPEQLNAAFIQMNAQYAALAREMKNVYFSNHMGITHFFFGIPEKGIKKYTTPFPGQYPYYEPLAGGDRRYGNTIAALLTLPFGYKNFVDPYHLNAAGFKVIGEHLVGYYVRHLLSK